MDILYISSATSEKALKKFSDKYMNGVPLKAPQQTFDLSFALGLSKYTNVNLLSIPPLPSFPKSKCIYFPGEDEKVNSKVSIKYIPLFNITFIKSICIFSYMLIKILAWNKKNKTNKKFIILHWPFFPTMFAAIIARHFTKNKVILTVPDLPSFTATYKKGSSILTFLKKLKAKIKPNLIDKFDGYVLLTEHMKNKLNIMNKPSLVIEGLIKYEDIVHNNTLDQKFPVKVIMYAGALYEKFGLETLVKAFHRYVKTDCELWLYGTGDFVSQIKKFEEKDERIKYKGIKFREEIIETEKKSTLLVNPRPTNEEFTKYSFPSKTLEYMASGTPVLSTRLEGIPEEYKEYIYWVDDESIEGFGRALNKIISMDPEILHEFGLKSQCWVKKNKNNHSQMKKLRDFLVNYYF